MSEHIVAREVNAANAAQTAMSAAILDFQAACIRHDWPYADDARLRAQSYLDAFLDHVAAAHRAME